MFKKIREFLEKKDSSVYPCCRHLHNGVTFEFSSIRPCCSNNCKIKFVENYKGGPINWNLVQKKRKQYIVNCKAGIIPKGCDNCVELETKEWEDNQKIGNIYFLHWDHCNCGCVYCLQSDHGEFLLKESKKSRFYDAFPLLQSLYKKNMVSKDVHVELVGGDLAVLDETNDIVNLVLSKGVGRFSFHSSMIDYCQGLENALKQSNMDVDFTVDCSNAEMYKKIKRTDSFEKVKANLKKYASCHESAPGKMVSKLILIDGFNDNIEEVENWLQFTKEVGVLNCKIDVNFKRFFPEYEHSDSSVPKHYYELFDYFYKRAKELGLNTCCWEYTLKVLEAGGIPDFSDKAKILK